MKRKVRLTESDLHRVIKESVNKILSEGNDYGDYEGTRYDKMNRANYNSYYFISSMEEKIKEILPEADIEKIHEDYFTVSDNTFNSINEMQQTITTLIGIFYSAYQETGDERFLVAAKGQIKLFQKEIEEKINKLNKKSNVKINFTFDFDNRTLNNYTPLSKDKVYDKDTETNINYSRLANVKDRKDGINGTFY